MFFLITMQAYRIESNDSISISAASKWIESSDRDLVVRYADVHKGLEFPPSSGWRGQQACVVQMNSEDVMTTVEFMMERELGQDIPNLNGGSITFDGTVGRRTANILYLNVLRQEMER